MYQQTTVIGRVGKDLEVKGSVGKFSVAATFKWLKDGNLQEKTTWFNCDMFGKMVDGVGRYIKKGQMIHVVGRIETSEYNGKYYWSLNVEKVTLLSKAEPAENRAPENRAPADDNYQPPSLDAIPF